MVRQPRPGRAAQHVGAQQVEAAVIDPVHPQPRHQRREGPRRAHHLGDLERLDESARQPVAPVVEVAGAQQRRAPRHLADDPVDQRVGLPVAALGEQAEVDHEAVDVAPVDPHHAVEHATLLERVVGEVPVLAPHDREARQQRVAVVAVQIVRVAAVGALEGVPERRRLREELLLRLARPVVEARRVPVVLALHLLQEDQVGVELVQPRAQFVHARHAAQPEQVADHALVDVVGGDPQPAARPLGRRLVGGAPLRARTVRGTQARAVRIDPAVHRKRPGLRRVAHRRSERAGSPRIASTFDQEKHIPAASSHGSQRYCRCSRGAIVTGRTDGTRSPNTCSVLCVTPSG